jgi:hypothetical protein
MPIRFMMPIAGEMTPLCVVTAQPRGPSTLRGTRSAGEGPTKAE